MIRNLLKHGADPHAKDPDPRTLRSVVDALDVNSIMLFRLAGYIPLEPNANSVRAEYLADVLTAFHLQGKGYQMAAATFEVVFGGRWRATIVTSKPASSSRMPHDRPDTPQPRMRMGGLLVFRFIADSH